MSTAQDAKKGEPTVELDASSYGFGWVQSQSCKATERIWHNGAIDSYRSALVLRTSEGVGVVVLTNFGEVDPMSFAVKAIEVLAATGAMKPRESGVPDASTYMASMTAFLDAYNTQDKDKLAAVLARPMDPREPDEIAGYKAMHGACTAFKLTEVVNGVLRFAMTCEHGPFELDVNMSGDKLGGFRGRSPGASPPENIRKIFQAAIALQTGPTWSDAAYKLVFPKKQIPEAQARAVAVSLHQQLGACKAGPFTQDALGWDVDLVCTKGDPTTLSIQFDAHGDLDGIFFHPARGSEPPRCPTK